MQVRFQKKFLVDGYEFACINAKHSIWDHTVSLAPSYGTPFWNDLSVIY